MARELTLKQRKFVKAYLEKGNGTQAAKEAFDVTTENSAASRASHVLRNDKVQAFLLDHAQEAAGTVLTLVRKAKNEAVRLNASKDILDRAGYKPVERSMHAEHVQINVSGYLNKAYGDESVPKLDDDSVPTVE